MDELKQEIPEIEVLIFNNGYQKKVIDFIKKTEKKFGYVCYVTLNKPYSVITEDFKKNNIDTTKFIFIDAITSTIKKPAPRKNCIFVSSPNSLTELSITIKELCKHDPKVLIFDSLSALLIYEKGPAAREFIHSLTNTLRVHNVKGKFIILKHDADSALMKDISMFADRVIEE
jgi:KaiC/GvpD/RAD55 family RecA-like ATPase